MENNYLSLLGKTVTVTVDRPMGSPHPERPEEIYPINYGYVEGLMGGDGEEQDVYILGVDEPVSTFTGRIIGVIHRLNDVEDKWVVAPEKRIFCAHEIMEKVRFREQYYQVEITALYERSCGGVLYCEENGVREYILIQNRSGHFGFPKGHMEPFETETQTAIREIKEETGLDAQLLPGFRQCSTYTVRRVVQKQTVYRLAYTKGGEIRIPSGEIGGFVRLPFTEAKKKLHFQRDRVILERAENFLNK